MRGSMIVVLAMLAAACGDNGRAPDNATPNAAQPVGNQVAALSQGQRDAVFIRAIRDAGLDCQRVQGSVRVSDYRGMPVWRARCQGGGEWIIVVTNDGTAQILNPAEAQSVTPPITNSPAPSPAR